MADIPLIKGHEGSLLGFVKMDKSSISRKIKRVMLGLFKESPYLLRVRNTITLKEFPLTVQIIVKNLSGYSSGTVYITLDVVYKIRNFPIRVVSFELKIAGNISGMLDSEMDYLESHLKDAGWELLKDETK